MGSFRSVWSAEIMTRIESGESRPASSMPRLIGWFSACLLAAAMGNALDDFWRPVWIEMGAFGLVAAVGLRAVERSRAAHARNVREARAEARAQCGLARLNQHSATVESINEAVCRLADYAARNPETGTVFPAHANRNGRRQLLNGYPLEITPLEDKTTPGNLRLRRTITGSLRQISSRAVSFEYLEAFDATVVLLTCSLGASQLSFGVDVLWTKKVDAGFASGGTVFVVGVPSSHAPQLAVASAGNA
jgi:hypothetical protein